MGSSYGPYPTPRIECLYYRLFVKDDPIAPKRMAFVKDTYVGRIRLEWVTPPYNAGSLRRCLSCMESIDPSKTKLFATLSSKSALGDGDPISWESGRAYGVSPKDPLVLVSEVAPKDGLEPGTESLHVQPDPDSAVPQRAFYYGIYTDGGVSASKKPIDEKRVWISQWDFNHIPPPHSVASLVRLISRREGITGPAQLFASKDAKAPFSNDFVLLDGDKWPGSTVENHIKFRTMTDSSPQEPTGSPTGCTGFLTGGFRIRTASPPYHYWTSRWYKPYEGNFLVLWYPLKNPANVDEYDSQIFFVNSEGHLCIKGGLELDVWGSSIILTRTRERTGKTWPNPWSHLLPTFSYAAESKTITVKFSCDPWVYGRTPRPDTEFAVAVAPKAPTHSLKFQEIVQWAPQDVQYTRKWSPYYDRGVLGDNFLVGVEEKAGDLSRMRWELEPL